MTNLFVKGPFLSLNSYTLNRGVICMSVGYIILSKVVEANCSGRRGKSLPPT